MHTELFINNEWRAATSGATIDVVNPATEETITAVQSASEADVADAVEAARACFESDAWQGMSARQRGGC